MAGDDMIKLKQAFLRLKNNDDFSDQFLKRIGDAKVIVFNNKQNLFEKENRINFDEFKNKISTNIELELPFSCQWIECINDFGTYIEKDGDSSNKITLKFLGALIKERSPKNYDVFVFSDASTYNRNGTSETAFQIINGTIQGYTNRNECIMFETTLAHISMLLDELNSKNEYGVTKHCEELRSGKMPLAKKEISEVIHIRPKSDTTKYKFAGRKIDWSHRWRVRGHWRKIDGVGKNRDGDYGIPNFTWVTEFIKGNESLPLIEKTRIVHAQS